MINRLLTLGRIKLGPPKGLCLGAAALLLVCDAVFSPLAANGAATIAYIGYATDRPFWLALGNALKGASDRSGHKFVDLTPPSASAALQAQVLKSVIRRKNVDGVIIGAQAPEVLLPVLNDARGHDIRIIAIDTPIGHDAIDCVIATDNLAGAVMAGEFIVDETQGKGSVLILGGTKGHPNGEARREGVTRSVEAGGMKAEFRQADWLDEKAYKYVSDALGKTNDISAIFSAWDPGIYVAAKIATDLGVHDDIVLVGFDGLPKTIDFINRGYVSATVSQDVQAMAEQSMQVLFDEPRDDACNIKIPPVLITSKK